MLRMCMNIKHQTSISQSETIKQMLLPVCDWLGKFIYMYQESWHHAYFMFRKFAQCPPLRAIYKEPISAGHPVLTTSPLNTPPESRVCCYSSSTSLRAQRVFKYSLVSTRFLWPASDTCQGRGSSAQFKLAPFWCLFQLRLYTLRGGIYHFPRSNCQSCLWDRLIFLAEPFFSRRCFSQYAKVVKIGYRWWREHCTMIRSGSGICGWKWPQSSSAATPLALEPQSRCWRACF